MRANTGTEDWNIRNALRLHAALMTKWEAEGYSRDEASRRAFREMPRARKAA